MRNLGAYRVDRRLKFELYKDVLKVLDGAARARCHSPFPAARAAGRTSSREPEVGLLGTTVTAYRTARATARRTSGCTSCR
jgi:glycerol-3-phosphate O-acyltransferase